MPATLMAAKFTRTGGILSSIDYYDLNAAAFVEQTLNVDMSESYRKFLSQISEKKQFPRVPIFVICFCGSRPGAKYLTPET